MAFTWKHSSINPLLIEPLCGAIQQNWVKKGKCKYETLKLGPAQPLCETCNGISHDSTVVSACLSPLPFGWVSWKFKQTEFTKYLVTCWITDPLWRKGQLWRHTTHLVKSRLHGRDSASNPERPWSRCPLTPPPLVLQSISPSVAESAH